VPQGWLVRDLRLGRRVTKLAPPEAVRIEPYDPGRHLEGIMALHESEPVRLARTRTEYAALLSLPKIDVRVLVREGRIGQDLRHVTYAAVPHGATVSSAAPTPDAADKTGSCTARRGA
jgi:hypothetical protein